MEIQLKSGEVNFLSALLYSSIVEYMSKNREETKSLDDYCKKIVEIQFYKVVLITAWRKMSSTHVGLNKLFVVLIQKFGDINICLQVLMSTIVD